MKKTVFAMIAIVCVLAAAFLIGTGLQKRTDVLMTDYSVTEDGTAIRLDVQVASSMGYVRGFKNDGGGVRPHYLNFYRTFGGLNSAWGAESSFLLPVEPEDVYPAVRWRIWQCVDQRPPCVKGAVTEGDWRIVGYRTTPPSRHTP